MATLDDLSLEDLQALRSGKLDGVSLDGLKKLKEVHTAADPASDPSRTQEQARGAQTAGMRKIFTETLPQIGADAVKGLGSLALLPAELLRSAGNAVPAGSFLRGGNLAMLPGELISQGAKYLAGKDPKFGEVTKPLTEAVDSFVPPPKTKLDKRVVEGGSAVATALVGPGNLARNALAGLGSAAGGMFGRDVGESLDPKTAGGNAPIIGGVLGATAGSLPTALIKTAGSHQEMLADALKGLKPADYAEARRLATQAQAQGVTLTLDQLFPRSPGMDELFNRTLANGAGKGELQSLVMQQPHQVAAALRNAANQFGPKVGAETSIRDLRLASEGALDDIGLTASQKQLFEGSPGQRVDGATLGALQDRLSALETQYRKSSPETADQFKRVLAILDGASEKAAIQVGTKPQMYTPEKGAAKHLVRQTPVTAELNMGAAVSDLDTIHKEAKAALDQIKLDTPATARQLTGKVAGGLDELKTLLDNAITTRPQGSNIYQSMQGRSDANSSGLLGRLAGRSGVNEANPDPLSMLRGTIGSADAPALAKLTAALQQRAKTAAVAGDPEASALATRAFPQGARELWDAGVDAALKSTNGRPPADAGARMYASVIGSPGSGKEAAFEQTLQGVAASNGNDPKALSDGFKSLLQVMEASGRNRMQAIPQEVKGLGESAGRDALKTATLFGVPSLLSAKLKLMTTERQYRQLADVFTNPAALDIVERIGRTPVMSSYQHGLVQSLFQILQQPGRAVSEEKKNVP